ncbi:phosphate--AMP phosphotransferase [Acinetobacter rathckeae]|uniref:phosphate--AMP phosphotransferase n=1 Tax=Acinetobacter rathckeae TaxID=2605272 RepID=UPI0018A2B4B6|nr:phosphate--AMP phosphotransferase [Acinetobacter rathckeae]MBF7688736.1 phosphate--AMP phosphotransferase [Acinetobacter rathckeae]MBF7696129.1 phosphate--AMP phosphotransferase [Acinetobacter rathckeae]
MEKIHKKQLSFELIKAQRALQSYQGTSQARSILILVSGVAFSPKMQAVKQLRTLLDPHGLSIHAHQVCGLDVKMPFWQSFVENIPQEGQITVLLGHWYDQLLATAMHQPMTKVDFQHVLQQIGQFERYLIDQRVEVMHFWFDLPWSELKQKSSTETTLAMQVQQKYGIDWLSKKQYQKAQQLRQSFTQHWVHIASDDPTPSLSFAQHILYTCQHSSLPKYELSDIKEVTLSPRLNVTKQATLSRERYEHMLAEYTEQFADLLRQEKRRVVLVFEGVDAAGKGGAIERVITDLDPLEYGIHSIAAPKPYELQRPYLWRFWRHLNQKKLTIFDRSWYGRVLVERVEQITPVAMWQKGYEEINQFEQDLVNHNTLVVKFWLAIDEKEQGKRFKSRASTPSKQFKITAEDWRNREKWADYVQAASDMLAYTDHVHAPWYVIATNDKRRARLEVLKAVIEHMTTTK